jgi:TRAP-type C4-dicarboxylate transport system substrate-binding protein
MTSLSTRLIDAASAPPVAAVAFRWYTRFDYMGEYPLGNVVSAMVIRKKEWDKISSENQAKIEDIARKFFLKAEDVIREKNRKSIELLKKAGIEVVRLDEKAYHDFIKTTSERTQEALVGKLFSRELLNKTKALLADYRKANPNSGVERIE